MVTRKHTHKRLQLPDSAGGFTIVELMIASLVFSLILIIVTTGVVYFSKSYYRGVHSSTVQTTTRTIADTVTGAIQFGSAGVVLPDNAAGSVGSIKQFCAGGYVFAFQEGAPFHSSQSLATHPGLYMRPMSDEGICAPLSNSDYTGGQQLLGENMRLTRLTLTRQDDNLYVFSFRVAYGDDDLLTATTGTDVGCKPDRGSEYCAVSGLTVSVQKRVVN